MIVWINKKYDISKCVRIVNPKQVSMYLKHGARPIDIYIGYDDRTVYVFKRDEVEDLFEKWVNYELD